MPPGRVPGACGSWAVPAPGWAHFLGPWLHLRSGKATVPTRQTALMTATYASCACVTKARSAQSSPVFRLPVPSQQGPGDSLVSVGSFPELVGSDPPGEVKKPHGVLKVEIRDGRVLDKRKQSHEMRACLGWTAPRLPTCKPLLLTLRKQKPHKLRDWSTGQRPEWRARAGRPGFSPWL